MLIGAKIAEATAKFEKQHRIVIPYPEPRPTKDPPYKISYSKPSQCNVVGSYVSRTLVKSQPSVGIDMVAQMPSSLFQDKDYLNLRYFYRRAYFLAYLAAHVRKEIGDEMTYNFECLHENALLPVLVLRPSAGLTAVNGNAKINGQSAKKSTKGHDYCIRLIPCAPDDLFPWSKLAPTASCLRLGDTEEAGVLNAATPFYNSTLNAERTFIQYLRVLTHAKTECAAFSDACVLGRIWLQQRGFGSAISQGGFGHFEWAITVALLLQMGGRNGQPALSNSLSSTELFKAVVQFLATTDLAKKPFAFHAPNIDMKAIRESGAVMFDPNRQFNILYKMAPWSANLLQIYAKSTVDMMADEAADKFQATFIMKSDVTFQVFDTVLEIDRADLTKFAVLADRSSPAKKFGSEVHRVLKKAFGNRAHLVHVKLPPLSHWSLDAPKPEAPSRILIGIIFDPSHMSRRMEYGPPAEEEKEAAAFRQFWGAKAELRRFKDGSILECVEWSSKQAASICEEIAVYSLNRHLKVDKKEISSYGDRFSSLAGLSPLDKEAFDSARQAFTKFENDIRGLDGLPLQIRQLSPVSSFARYSSLEPPLVGFHKDTIEPIDVNLYFEASSKWPENLTAIQEAKIEFLLDFDRRLTSANDHLSTYLGRENRDVGTENLAYLDVVYQGGAAFRLRIFCDLEGTLLQRQVQDKTLDHHARDDAVQAVARFDWQFAILPLHSQTIATFCTRLQPLSPSIRLVKRWFCSHKLSGHFTEELIELLVLHVFLQPYPWKMPSSPMTGLLRTLLFLSRWDWRDEPLIVDSAEDMTSDDRATMCRTLATWRKRDPHMNHLVMFVASSHDSSGTAYTQNGPSKLIASRATRLAKAACKLIRDEDLHIDPQSLFESSLRDYDVLIHLSAQAIQNTTRHGGLPAPLGSSKSHARHHVPSQYKNLDVRTGKTPLPVRTHPGRVLVEELERTYRDSLFFFSGRPDDDGVVAAIWNPKLQASQKFRIGLPYNFVSVGESGQDEGSDSGTAVEVNKKAVLLEIARIGGDMIRKIEVIDEDD